MESAASIIFSAAYANKLHLSAVQILNLASDQKLAF